MDKSIKADGSKKPLVSLIIPCYNAEKYIERCVKSILQQTYKNIQLIIVNDGSTDKTKQILKIYSKKIKNNFLEYKYLEKDNGGAASAINLALKYVKGKYLAWADADDVLYPDNIQEKVDYLENNKSKGLVMCQAEAIDFATNKVICQLRISQDKQNENIFEQLIFEGIPCYPGVFMIHTKYLMDKLNSKEIYHTPEVGQNWQLLLPVAYDNKCGYINKCLYSYYIRNDSHSHCTDYDKELERTYKQERVLEEILYFLNEQEKNNLLKRIHSKYLYKRLQLSFEQLDKKTYINNYLELKKITKVSKKIHIKYLIVRYGFIKIVFVWLKKKGKR